MSEFNLDNITRTNIKKLVPYSSARSEYEGDAQVFLDANENSLGSLLQQNFHRYPDPLQKNLKEKISAIKNINIENIFIGNGSDEAIDLLIRAFCNPGKDEILIFPPTYGMYEVSAAINDVEIKEVLLTDDFELNIPAIKKTISDKTKIIFVCSPNNPTGNSFNENEIEDLVNSFNGIIVIDEAYIDFSDKTSWLEKLNQYPNLVILQTLSKAWALAGLRIGMAFASAEIIRILNKIKPPYNISAATQKLALQVLNDEEKAYQKIVIIKKEKAKLSEDLKAFDFIKKIYPSDTNFLLVKVNDATRLYKYLLTKNIVVRNRSNQPLCDNSLRITIGTPEENVSLLQALKSFSA
ncbi:MAG TPA: histidinol-phosphate transaminase [Parafilimonas sp.]|nr:histidinol-phosphate transaminase [Parafilimonas sp.]